MTRILDKAWSDVQPGNFVRWRTPRFIKYGVVLTHKDRSITFQCADENRPVVIPDARWYFVEGKMKGHDAEESFFVIDELPAGSQVVMSEPPRLTAHDLIITVPEACELIRMDPKQFRRHIRRGVITASKSQDGRWLLRRDLLMETAAKYGWL